MLRRRRAAGWVTGLAASAGIVAGCYSSGAEAGDTGGDTDTGCRFDRECSDGDPCNGEERCGTDGACVSGALPARDTPCSHPSGGGVCRDGACVPATCGNGVVDPYEECDDANETAGDGCDGHCVLGCRSREECNDANACTTDGCVAVGRGQECVHDPLSGDPCSDEDACTVGDACVAGTCVPGGPLDCTDTDPCTLDLCIATTGCRHDPRPTFYRDVDGDGWGVASDSVCGDATPRGYVARAGDCCDVNAAVHPDADFHDAPYACTPEDVPTFDYDCNGVEDREYIDLATACIPSAWGCSGTSGWCPADTAYPDCRGVPACGETGVTQFGCSLEPPTDGGSPGGGKADAPASAGVSGPDAGLSGSPIDDPLDAGATKDHPPAEAEVPPDTSGWVCVAGLEADIQACR